MAIQSEQEISGFIAVCRADSILPGRHAGFEVEGTPVLICNVGGQYHAVVNLCTHQQAPLEGGRQMGHEIICRKHAARFDIRTGASLSGPAVRRLAVYTVRVTDGMVEVALTAPPMP